MTKLPSTSNPCVCKDSNTVIRAADILDVSITVCRKGAPKVNKIADNLLSTQLTMLWTG